MGHRLTVLGLNDLKPSPPDPVAEGQRYLASADRTKSNLVTWLYNKLRGRNDYGVGEQYRRQANYRSLMDSYTTWVYAAVDLIAKAMMNLDYSVYQYKPGKRGMDRVKVEDHPFLDLLKKPNPRQTESEFFYALAATFMLSPDVCLWMPPGQSNQPGLVRILEPEWLYFIEDRAKMAMVSYVYTTPGGAFTIPPEEIVHFRHPMEMSPMMAAARAYDATLYAQLYRVRFYQNNARPDLAIVYKGKLPPGKEREIWNAWDDRHRGPDNAYRPAILDSEADIKLFAAPTATKQFLEEAQLGRDEIFWTFGVPPAKLDQTANRATSEAADFTFRRDTVAPLATLFSARITQDIIRSKNRYPTGNRTLAFEFDNPVPEDKEFDQKDREQRLKLGISNIDDLRAERGLEPLPNGQGQTYYLQSGLVPVDMVGLGIGIGGGLPPALPEGKALALPRSQYRVEVRPALPMKAPAGCSDRELLVLAGQCIKRFKAVPPAVQAELWDRHVKRLDPREVQFNEAVGAYFREQKARVLKAVEASYPKSLDLTASPEKRLKAWRKKSIPELGPSLWDLAEEIELFFTMQAPFLKDMVIDGLVYAMRQLTGNEPDLAVERIRKWLENTNRKYSTAVLQESELQIRQRIIRGIADGEGVGEVGSDIAGMFDGWEKWRGVRIARTELNAAANAGTLEGYRQSGIVDRREWLSAIDERTRSIENGDEFDHVAANGEVTGIDGMFTATGEPLAFPGDPDGSPGNCINCRCTQVAVIEGDEVE